MEEVVLRLGDIAKPSREAVFLEKTGAAATLWSAFKQRQQVENRRFLLVFDQFEEFFSYPLPQQERFAEELSELIYTDIPQTVFEDFDQLPEGQQLFLSKALDVKAVFAIRSDRLHLLDQLKDRLPAILHKRYELKALARDQAREAVEKPARLKGDFASQPFEYLPDALTSILDQLSKFDKTAGQTGIETFLLQVLCQYFEDKVLDGSIRDHTGDSIPDVRPEDLPDLNTIYETYYKRRLAELPETDLLPARLLVENGLLFVDKQSGDARRLSMDGQALVAQFEHR
ncbi:MAG TPA: hypothetical protein PK228_14150, partial [Saprospiraceae bacterium]|nr:hypothetical protein [Saprospiraceae bacterium]